MSESPPHRFGLARFLVILTYVVRVHIDAPLSVDVAAWYLDLKPATVYKLVQSEEVACFRPNGKRLYFKRVDLDAYAFRHRRMSWDELDRESATRAGDLREPFNKDQFAGGSAA